MGGHVWCVAPDGRPDLGHAKARSSERYGHLGDGYLSDAADRVADAFDLDMARKTGGAS